MSAIVKAAWRKECCEPRSRAYTVTVEGKDRMLFARGFGQKWPGAPSLKEFAQAKTGFGESQELCIACREWLIAKREQRKRGARRIGKPAQS